MYSLLQNDFLHGENELEFYFQKITAALHLSPFSILLCSSLSFSPRPTDSHFWPQSCFLMFVISPLYKHNKTKTTFGLQIYLPHDFLIRGLSNPWPADVRAPPWLSRPCLNTTEKKRANEERLRNWREDDYSTESSCAWKGISFHRSVL